MELRTRAAVSTYVEVFVLIGVAMAGSALVYGVTNSYSAALGGPGVTVSTLSIKQGQQIALLQVQIANTGTTTINSFTTTTSGISLSYPYLVYLDSGNSVTTGLIGYWPMNEGSGTTTADLSGSGNTGTLVNSPTWQSGANCKFGGCLYFAAGPYVSVPSASALNLVVPYTISLWIYDKDNTLNGGFLDKGYNSGGYMIWQQGNAGTLVFYCNNVDDGDFPLLSLNVWSSVVVSVDSTGSHVYENGVLVTTGASCSPTGNTAPLKFGSEILGRPVNALEDDIRIYNRALSASEASAIYASSVGSVTQPTTTGPGQSVTVTILIFSPNAFAIGRQYSVSVSASGAVEQVNGVAIPA